MANKLISLLTAVLGCSDWEATGELPEPVA